ncbi:hypothetical protein LARI1_G007164 [Lachnellula arida]|uniref:DUF2241 domain-containing protein n=1 Tax=Lachnellula arida TaxID=1316785 RepID=A0A8T9B4L4_9HELO|nr:hypothetical protein LARI1_G007164 [Lachnellula arida]
MGSSINSPDRDLSASCQRHTIWTIITHAAILLTRSISFVALYVTLGFAQCINSFFFAIIFIFILAPGHFRSIAFPEADEEDIMKGRREDAVGGSMAWRRDTEDISVFSLNGSHRTGRLSEAKRDFSTWLLERKSELGRDSRVRRESVGSWLEGLEEEAVESESEDESVPWAHMSKRNRQARLRTAQDDTSPLKYHAFRHSLSPGSTSLKALLSTLITRLDPETFVFITIPPTQTYPSTLLAQMLFKEAEGLTIIATKASAEAHDLEYVFPCRMLTLDVHSSLVAVGFMAVVAGRLSERGIACNPVSGYFHDHLFVQIGREEEALGVLSEVAVAAKADV